MEAGVEGEEGGDGLGEISEGLRGSREVPGVRAGGAPEV